MISKPLNSVEFLAFLPLMSNPVTQFNLSPTAGRTLAYQDRLPKLPIPPLEDTCGRYLRALQSLQDEKEHGQTKAAVKDFLENDGPRIQDKLKDWAKNKHRCGISMVWW
jgi:carnitine O-acetyltransferase